MADTDIPFPLTHRKLETQTLGVVHLKFFHTINIYEMVAIFQFFHNTDIPFPFMCGDPSALRKPEMLIFHLFSFSYYPSQVPFQHLKHLCVVTFLHSKKPEMQIFHWFSYLNFPLVRLSPSLILGPI